MVFGAFGNPMSCGAGDQFLIAYSHPNFKELYAAILAAQGSGKQVSAYVQQCDPVLWYTGPTTTFPALKTGGSVRTRD